MLLGVSHGPESMSTLVLKIGLVGFGAMRCMSEEWPGRQGDKPGFSALDEEHQQSGK